MPYGPHGSINIGSLSSKDMIEWMEANDDPVKKREAGLRLIVKSVCGTEDEGYPRVPEGQFDAFLEIFRDKDARANGNLVKEILALNEMKLKGDDSAKNASSEAPSDASR